MRALVLSAALLVPTLAATIAQAQAPAASTQADRLFREGRASADAGDYTTARDRFLASERLDPAPGTLLNVADCEVHLGLLVNAREHFQLAASGFPRTDSRRAWATTRAAEIEKRLARLTLRLDPDSPPGTVVTKNGTPVDPGTLGAPALSDPGNVEIVVTAPGRQPRKTAFALAEGQSFAQAIAPGPPESVESPATVPPGPASDTTAGPPPASSHPPPLRTIGFVVGGVGLAGIVAGSITGVLALDRASTVKSHCNTTTWACDGQGVDAASSGNTFATVSTISFIAGAVLVGAGAYLVLSGGGLRGAQPTTAIMPYIDPRGAGAAFARSF